MKVGDYVVFKSRFFESKERSGKIVETLNSYRALGQVFIVEIINTGIKAPFMIEELKKISDEEAMIMLL